MWGLYRDCYRDLLTHSPLSTRKNCYLGMVPGQIQLSGSPGESSTQAWAVYAGIGFCIAPRTVHCAE